MNADNADGSVDWAKHMLRELSRLSDSHDPSDRRKPIFRAYHEETSYRPKLVSIGFYRPGIGDKYKLIYLKDLFDRRCGEENEERYMAALFTALDERIDRALQCYRDLFLAAGDELQSGADIARRMLVDGCFIIELLYKIHFPGLRREDDEIFEENLVVTMLTDLILVENQVPFFILDKLFEMTKLPEEKLSLAQLAQSLPNLVLPAPERISEDELKPHELHHLLDLVYKTCTSRLGTKIISGSEGHHDPESVSLKHMQSETDLESVSLEHIRSETDLESVSLEHIESASELEQIIGVKFKKARKGTPWLDITWENGVIRIPAFVADHRTERVLRNLIAYELGMKADAGSTTPVTDYALFLHDLIKSPKDVEKLASCGIVTNRLNDNEALCRMFHVIAGDVGSGSGSRSCYSEILEGVNKLSGSRWNVWMVILKRNYFSTPLVCY